jgi:hypothetical protein
MRDNSVSTPCTSMPTVSGVDAARSPSQGLSNLQRATHLATSRLQHYALMPPPAPRPASVAKRAAAEVLDEDEWTLRLEQIVERDYFPDLTKLKARLDWLEATRRCAISPRVWSHAQERGPRRSEGLMVEVGVATLCSKDPVRISNVLNSLRGTPMVQVCLLHRRSVAATLPTEHSTRAALPSRRTPHTPDPQLGACESPRGRAESLTIRLAVRAGGAHAVDVGHTSHRRRHAHHQPVTVTVRAGPRRLRPGGRRR